MADVVCDHLAVDVVVDRTRAKVLGHEVLLVLGVSLGASAVYAIVSIIAKLTREVPLSSQTTAINTSLAPGRPWLDLTYQLLGIVFSVVPVLLALHLLNRDGGNAYGRLGLDAKRPGFDIGTGLGLAALIGLPGLALYAGSKALGINTTVATANLPDVWWAIPVLVLNALANGVLEEVVVVGYLVSRLRDIGWAPWLIVASTALLRGSYHLYQGFGAFIGNALMGVIFALFFMRTRRVLPLIIAHTILDLVAYLGYLFVKARFPSLLP